MKISQLAFLFVLGACSAGLIDGDHKVRRLPYWQKHQTGTTLSEKIVPADDELIDFLWKMNEKGGFSERPTKVSLSTEQKSTVVEAIADLPSKVQQLINDNILGIAFVENLGGSGLTESLLGEAYRKGFMVFDIKVLRLKANDWCSWKENTPFAPAPGWKLRCRIERKSGDTVKNAFQYIFLHEAGHALNLTAPYIEHWNDWITTEEKLARQRFPRISWTFQEHELVSKDEAAFPLRKKVRYYSDQQLPMEQAKDVYQQLEKTSFPTLYAATNYGDDWAEAFANYVHVVMLKRPFEIELTRDGKKVLRYEACWRQKRCAEKEAILREHLATPQR